MAVASLALSIRQVSISSGGWGWPGRNVRISTVSIVRHHEDQLANLVVVGDGGGCSKAGDPISTRWRYNEGDGGGVDIRPVQCRDARTSRAHMARAGRAFSGGVGRTICDRSGI